MAIQHTDSEDFLEKSSRSSNKKNKNRAKGYVAEGEQHGMQKKMGFKRYMLDLTSEQDDFENDFDEE